MGILTTSFSSPLSMPVHLFDELQMDPFNYGVMTQWNLFMRITRRQNPV